MMREAHTQFGLLDSPHVLLFFRIGADEAGIIRSLALPNLSDVTREAARDYFANSWTLYETLFAGLKGEEGFYRYVTGFWSRTDYMLHCAF
jgi:hypothetical protein